MLSKAKFFSVLDATSGYYQIHLKDDDKIKTAFKWKNYRYELYRMPFGLVNAPSTYQETMDKIFEKEKGKFVISYLDDTIIFSDTYEEHIEHLRTVFLKLKSAGITLNKKKCKLFKTRIKILGNIVENGKVAPDPEKVKIIKEYKRPENLKELLSFLGFANYMRDFVRNFSHISFPLYACFKGEKKTSVKKIDWTEERQLAFENLKNVIANITFKSQPDFNQPFILITDASTSCIGAILAQKDNITGKEKMIHTFSKVLDKCQTNYSISEKELLAIIKAFEHFKYYLIGRKFILRSDHKALEYLSTTKNENSRLLRWSLKMQEYKYDFEYIKGETNPADGISRQMITNKKENIMINNIKEDHNQISETEYVAIFWKTHIMTGHGGTDTMHYNLKEKLNISNLREKIIKFIEKCEICKAASGPNSITKNKIINSNGENDLWECDLIGPLKGAEDTNKFIFVAIDHFSKWVETSVINNKESKIIYKMVEDLIIKKHGIPRRILTDNGCEFKNKEIRSLTNKYKFDWIYNSPGNHQTMGVVERVNRSLLEKLRKLNLFDNRNWEDKVKKATYAQNISYHRGIRASPYVFKYGKMPDIVGETNLNQKSKTYTRDEILNKRNKYIDHYNKKYIEKGKKDIKDKFVVDEKVLVYKEKMGDKLGTNWNEGYKVVEVLDNDSYIVAKDGRFYRVHTRFLKRGYF